MKCSRWATPISRQKCLGKMEKSPRGGRTVLFVSHNMATIGAFCSRAITLKQGRLFRDGPPAEVAEEYLRDTSSPVQSQQDLTQHPNRRTSEAFFTGFCMRNQDGAEANSFAMGEKIVFELELDARSGC